MLSRVGHYRLEGALFIVMSVSTKQLSITHAEIGTVPSANIVNEAYGVNVSELTFYP